MKKVAENAVQEGHDDDASTRQRVAQSILEQGPSTAAELAERLGLTPAAIRRHLTALVERNQVSSREKKIYGQRGRGRPSKVFLLTDEGRATFYQAYDDLAIQALKALASVGGSAAVTRVAEERFGQVERRYLALREADPDRSPVDLLAEALTADGYVASLKPARFGEQLCQHHCPVAHVATEFPELCEAETQLFSRLLGSHVQRLATIAHGDGVCTTHIPLASMVQRFRPPLPSHT
ncbi:helix-turn-helix transcriptional regulator [Aestuariimicrobium kwangyangense]|uniref:helix-turn-helix transcriptional regulator n=1 Tax=Aestuariimicrobium kwangyangense TaxID=396389 RepID=UPI001B7FCCBB|nr:metalloregulator ArsR/SmtB family transcription factor [Aestuariimicrobium kwangyangense]